MPLNFQTLEREILQAIRGSRSQTDLSHELGFKYNQLYRFERGLVRLSWSDSIKICHHCGIDMKSSFELFFDRNLEPFVATNVVKTLIGNNSLEFIAKAVQKPKRTIQRWLDGETEPLFQDILKLIYKCTNWLFEFAAHITRGKGLPTYAHEIEVRRLERTFHFDHPEFAGIIRAFELTDYERAKTHSDTFVAKKTGLTPEHTKALIQKALKLGIIKKTQGKYTIVNKSLTTAGDIDGKRKVLLHWMQRQMNGIEHTADFKGDPIKSSYLVFTGSPLITEKIKDLTTAYYHGILSVLHNREHASDRSPLDRVMLMQINMMNIEHLPVPIRTDQN